MPHLLKLRHPPALAPFHGHCPNSSSAWTSPRHRTDVVQPNWPTWVASVVSRPWSLTNQLLRTSLLSRNFAFQSWPERRTRWHHIKYTHSSKPTDTCQHTRSEWPRSAWRKVEDSTNPPSHLSQANCRKSMLSGHATDLWTSTTIHHGTPNHCPSAWELCRGLPSLTATDIRPTAEDLSGLQPS